MKIYTKKGDQGSTGLIGGTRVPKHSIRIDAYGTIDELNAFIGYLGDHDIKSIYKEQLLEIQDRLFTIGSSLAADPEKSKMSLPDLLEKDVFDLEKWIDEMDELLPEMRYFVLPGGHPAVSAAHLARCVCRRGERIISELNEREFVAPLVMSYINRLSDYLFVLGRKITQDLDIQEKPWRPRM
jgi:cob(I)alamin adenosyltransferase